MHVVFSDSIAYLKVFDITEQNAAELLVRSLPEAHRGSLHQCLSERAAYLTESNGTT
jgi:hypothetical protein